MRLPHQVECWVYKKVNNEHLFLLLKRVSKKGGFWQPITGGIESTAEDTLETCYRELYEETNILKKDIINTVYDAYNFEFEYEDKNGDTKISKEFCFGFEVASDFKIDISKNPHFEHEKIEWLKYEDAIKILKWQDNKDALKELYNKL